MAVKCSLRSASIPEPRLSSVQYKRKVKNIFIKSFKGMVCVAIVWKKDGFHSGDQGTAHFRRFKRHPPPCLHPRVADFVT